MIFCFHHPREAAPGADDQHQGGGTPIKVGGGVPGGEETPVEDLLEKNNPGFTVYLKVFEHVWTIAHVGVCVCLSGHPGPCMSSKHKGCLVVFFQNYTWGSNGVMRIVVPVLILRC